MTRVEKARAEADAAYRKAHELDASAKAAWLVSEQADRAYGAALTTAVENAKTKAERGTTFYLKGDLAEYTGETFLQGNVTFHRVILLEGHRKGKTEYTSRAPHDAGSQVLNYLQGNG